MRKKNYCSLLLAIVMICYVLTGCGSTSSAKNNTPAPTVNEYVNSNQQTGSVSGDTANSSGKEYVDVEIWNQNRGFLAVEKGGALYNYYKNITGVGITQPYVEWNGGETYGEMLNQAIIAGETPDIFQPVNGIEAELASQGALLDLTELLPEKAPHLWETIPEEVWNVMRSMDPNGEGRIYYIPQVVSFPRLGALIREDWLDAVNLEMPTTQEEFVNVLRAFKEQDPNGNGEADEIPTGGRADARWMDYLFSMYGIAMWEGYPQWDIYDGELTYAAVTPNMKDALEFIHGLYAEGLIDPETLLNDKAAWDGKINSGKVGIWYHWMQTYEFGQHIKESTGVQAEISAMPPISADGYEAFYTQLQVSGIQYVVNYTEDQDKIDAVMQVLDCYGNQDMWLDFYFGVEGMHCERKEDGTLMQIPENMKTQENLILQPYSYIATIPFTIKTLELSGSEEFGFAYADAIENLQEAEAGHYGKTIAGDGMPTTVYGDYTDIQNRLLWNEYATKIITGDYAIEKFDEFVDKWYSSGGTEVTKNAREWYASAQK